MLSRVAPADTFETPPSPGRTSEPSAVGAKRNSGFWKAIASSALSMPGNCTLRMQVFPAASVSWPPQPPVPSSVRISTACQPGVNVTLPVFASVHPVVSSTFSPSTTSLTLSSHWPVNVHVPALSGSTRNDPVEHVAADRETRSEFAGWRRSGEMYVMRSSHASASMLALPAARRRRR